MIKLHPRSISAEIGKYIDEDNIIVLHGARQVGKTSIMQSMQDALKNGGNITHYIDLEDSRYTTLLNQGVDMFVKHLTENGLLTANSAAKKIYVFIDEIHYLDEPSSFLKLIADHHKNIKLIVSASSSFEIKSKFKDSLVGRTVTFEVFNLSFAEFLIFKQYPFSADGVYTEHKINELTSLFKEYVLYGGYPKIVLTEETEKKERYLQQIIDTYIKKDIIDLAKIKDVGRFNKLLEILAAQSGQQLNITELANTIGMAKATIERYIFLLENTYIIKLVRPYSTNMRKELFKLPKVYFYDTGLLQMLWLKAIPKEVMGNVFETSIFVELAKKYGKEAVYYWRTKDQKEIDFIVKIANSLLPIETKLNFAAGNLSAINYFMKKYSLDNYKIVALSGTPKNDFQVYPWGI